MSEEKNELSIGGISMKIIVLPAQQIAGFITDALEQQLYKKPTSVLGMTTGSTPLTLGIYQEWVKRANNGDIDFSRATFVNPDELVGLSENHPETYRMYMKKHLFSQIGVSNERAFIPNGGIMDPEEECCQFEFQLKALGGIDWQLMGLGLNGHIAFIEPADSIPSTTYVVKLEEVNCPRLLDLGSEKIITHAITVGLGTVIGAGSVMLAAVGEKKADIVAQALIGPVTTRVPASFLQLHSNATIVLDEGAASKLPENLLVRLN